MELAQSYDLKVIEDSCEAIGAEHRGRKVGSIAPASVFAFYPNRQMTTGGGGWNALDSLKDLAGPGIITPCFQVFS